MRTNVIRKWIKFPHLHSYALRHSTHVQYREIIAAKNPKINAFVHVSEPPSSPKRDLPLSGLTIAVKDNIATSRLLTTCSSAMLRDFVSPLDATVVKLLEENGADIIGKTNCDEFGMGSLNVHSVHGPVKNPIGLFRPNIPVEERSAGGSSGGSAAAVAAGMCDAALGTDTGGSVRLPASYCGVVGFKPSYGLVSRWGVVSYADSLDCVGVLASNVDTAKHIFDRIALYDSLDPTSAPKEIRGTAQKYTDERILSVQSNGSILNGLRIGIPQEYFPSEMSPTVIKCIRRIISQLKSQGATIVPVSLPSTSYALSSYYVLASAEASSNLARYDGVQYGSHVRPVLGTDLRKTSQVYAQTRSVNFGQEVQKRVLLGAYALSADAFDNYFLQAQRVRQLVKDDFNRVFSIANYSDAKEPQNTASSVDVLIHPSAIGTAPLLAESTPEKSNLSSYVQDVLTVPASLGGLPALSIPVNVPEEYEGENAAAMRWPIGVSVVGQWGTDKLVLMVGKAIETLQRQGVPRPTNT
ncbi:hypothetical protein GALMADRAFT_241253 [Galerina marginata CBS 339.88]|uniref:Glutamyl-tRNA(Gln) amidotransferase subunit A, mitochondrial n=1 Tax=Galerina marginata (strain CBS 339.88) TaxID=685588 RepID=A0A067TCB6_GALM3|nr:hypothetical protein GALMADRAFT_241253 [Galerina marginata CBS 339.88]